MKQQKVTVKQRQDQVKPVSAVSENKMCVLTEHNNTN